MTDRKKAWIENYDPETIYVCKNNDGMIWFVQGLEAAHNLDDLLYGFTRSITVEQVGYLDIPFARVVMDV